MKRIFNYRLSRAGRIVENVFGILSAIFRVLRKPILLEPDKAELVVLACIYLHNFLRKNQSTKHVYTPNGSFDSEVNGEIIPGSWRQQTDNINGLKSISKVPRKSPSEPSLQSILLPLELYHGKITMLKIAIPVW